MVFSLFSDLTLFYLTLPVSIGRKPMQKLIQQIKHGVNVDVKFLRGLRLDPVSPRASLANGGLKL